MITAAGPHRYRHYGLTLESNVVLSALPDATGDLVDLTLQVARCEDCPVVDAQWVMVAPPTTAWRAPGKEGSHVRLQFHGGSEWADFVIEHGGERVRMSLGMDVDLDEATELLLGTVFSCILAQRGATCLHASVVELHGSALALVGGKGAGKSTLALALVQRGARLVSDDIAVLSGAHGSPKVAVGRPRLRVRADSAEALAGSYAALRPMWVHEELRVRKRYHDADDDWGGTIPSWIPLTAVYLLAPRGERLQVRPIGPAELLPRLMANRHMANLIDHAGHRRDFQRLAASAVELRGRELLRPDDLGSIATVADAVLADRHADHSLALGAMAP